MTTLVIGPSSAGKSTLLASDWLLRRAPEAAAAAVVFAHQLKNADLDPSTAFVHYNLTHFLLDPALAAMPLRDEPLSREPLLSKILAASSVSKAIVLVAPRDELLARAARREHVEQNAPDARYDSKRWVSRLQDVDLFTLYEQVFALLAERGIPAEVVFSSPRAPGGFAVSDRAFVHHNLRGNYLLPPEPVEVARVRELPGCGYQVVDLPLGETTAKRGHGHVGDNREATFRAIFPDSLAGASVLDIGCATGELLYRAERHGASRLVGLEPNAERATAAREIGRVLFSAAVVHRCSLDQYVPEEAFDHVLILNVLHHVRDIDSFLAKAASLALRSVAIEFPSLTDEKFALHRGGPLDAALNELPLIGVSGAGVDQTYVFAPEAVKALMIEAVGGFASVRDAPSPIANRHILVFSR